MATASTLRLSFLSVRLAQAPVGQEPRREALRGDAICLALFNRTGLVKCAAPCLAPELPNVVREITLQGTHFARPISVSVLPARDQEQSQCMSFIPKA